MGGKYEIRYYLKEKERIATCGHKYHCNPPCTMEGIIYRTKYTNSWFELVKIRLTRKVIYYKVIVD